MTNDQEPPMMKSETTLFRFRSLIILFCGSLVLFGIGYMVHFIHTKISPRDDVAQMGMYAFAGDLVDFAKQYGRLPNSWIEYGNWRGEGSRSVDWCTQRFEIVSWGTSIADVTTNMVVVRMIQHRNGSLETNVNQWLGGLLRGLNSGESKRSEGPIR